MPRPESGKGPPRPGKRPARGGLDRPVGNVQAAQFVPFGSVAREIVCRTGLSRRADHAQMLAIFRALAGEIRVRTFRRNEHPAQRRAKIGAKIVWLAAFAAAVIDRRAEKHPAALTPAFGEASVTQDLDVARNARLALAEDLRQFANGQFHARQQAHDPEACWISKGSQGFENKHGVYIKQSLYNARHIKISLYTITVPVVTAVWRLPWLGERIRTRGEAASIRPDVLP